MYNVSRELRPKGVQTTLLSNDHHPVLIEFEPEPDLRVSSERVPRSHPTQPCSAAPTTANLTTLSTHNTTQPDPVLTKPGRQNHFPDHEEILAVNPSMLSRQNSSGRLLETHFDEPYSHIRSSSQSNLPPVGNETVSPQLNSSFPGAEAPYISSSVTLPAKEDLGFYQNLSGRFRQSAYRTREEQRASFSRQAEMHKSPKTQELEEFAAKFEGYQKQRSRRNLQPTPMLDQLARENQAQFWLNNPDHLSPLESNLLKLVQRTDSINRRTISDDSSSGRESVTTVISNCSSETLKYTDRHSSSETLRYSEPGDAGTELEGDWTQDHLSREDQHQFENPYGNYMNMSENISNYPLKPKQWIGTHGTNRKILSRSMSESSKLVEHPENLEPYGLPMSKAGLRIEDGLSQVIKEKEETVRSGFNNPGMQGEILGSVMNERNLGENQPLTRQGQKFPIKNEPLHRDSVIRNMNLQREKERNETLLRGEMRTETLLQDGFCSFCNIRHTPTSIPCQAPRFEPEQIEDPNTMPRRTTRRKPKLPTPPCSPNISVLGRGTCSTPSPPPPPLPEIDLITTSEPLPPPPPLTAAKFSRQNGIIPAPAGPQFVFQPASSKGGIRNSSYAPGTAGTAAVAGSVGTAVSPYGRSSTARQTVNHQHQQQSFNRQPSTSAQQLQTTARQPTTPPKQSHSVGRQPANTPPQVSGRQPADSPPHMTATGRQPADTPPHLTAIGRQPANTPKRDSPATIAAKEAPGWQMFLGVKSSTVSFTSEEASKFRAARDESRTRIRREDRPPPSSTQPRDERMSSMDDLNVLERTYPRDERTYPQLEHSRIDTFSRDENFHSGPAGDDTRPRNNVAYRDELGTRMNRDEPAPARNELGREASMSRLRRTESRGRKRSENPNRSCNENENIDPNKKRQNLKDRNVVLPRSSNEKFLRNFNKFSNGQELNRSVEEEEKNEKLDDEGGSSENKQQNLHLSRERSLKSISNWWKSSLDSGPTPPNHTPTNSSAQNHEWNDSTPSPKHNHSHSDSGISSLSGRSSCISPMSDLSSSSGSSRTSLRSSSIVSASNIPVEEEPEELDLEDLYRDLLVFSPKDSRVSCAIKSCLAPSLSVYFPEGSLEFEIRSNQKESLETESPRRNHSSSFEESRKKVLSFVSQRVQAERKHQALLRETVRLNDEVGKDVLGELRQVAQQMEVDKVRVFIEEVDKITSLVIGLTSRLVRANLNPRPDNQKSQVEFQEKQEKLLEQLEEARKLRQSIFRRAQVVFRTLAKYLPDSALEGFGGFIKEKIRLILDTRQLTEGLKNMEEIIKCLKEYSNGVMII